MSDNAHMSIQTRLMVFLLACGLAPMGAVGIVTFLQSRSSANTLQGTAIEELESRSKDQLQAVATARGQDIKHYFEMLQGHVASLGQQDTLARLTQDFSQALQQLPAELSLEVPAMRRELANYYQRDFDAEFRKHNNKASPAETILGQLDDIAVAAQLVYLQRNPHPLGRKDAFAESKDDADYSLLHRQHHEDLRSIQQAFGYYDLFLLDRDGRVVYSVCKEVDFGTHLGRGPWSSSNLGVMHTALQSTPLGKTAFQDFRSYGPSYEAPAAFLGAPLARGGERVGAVVVQLPINRINQVASATEGMGKTGEIVLVGPDRLMRSDSRHNPTTHSVVASFRDPKHGSFDTAQVQEALNGNSGAGIVDDVDGARELTWWQPIEVLGTRWAMIAKFEVSEILAGAVRMTATAEQTASSMLWWTLSLMLATGLLVGGASWWLARQIVLPIRSTVRALADIAEGEGNLTARLDQSRRDELGELGQWFNRFLGRLQETVKTIAQKANEVGSASSQLTATAHSLAEGAERTRGQTSQVAAAAEEMSANMASVSHSSEAMAGTFRTVAAAVEQMTASIGEVAKSASGAASVAGTAAELTRSSNEKVSALGAAANEIGRVIETIQDIAEQTNLLALNATIEAARAGEAGKGFSVVANEVKDLARQTAEATQDIRQRIERIQASTTESVKAIAEIDQVIAKVSQASQTIATSVAEQRSATQEIASNLAQSTRSIETVANNVREGVAASQDISKSIAEVDQHAQATAAGAEQTSMAGRSMASLAQDLMQVVGSFRT
jgi:methyl-accepting chemotaxis protein